MQYREQHVHVEVSKGIRDARVLFLLLVCVCVRSVQATACPACPVEASSAGDQDNQHRFGQLAAFSQVFCSKFVGFGSSFCSVRLKL